jgi:hypothetical protein
MSVLLEIQDGNPWYLSPDIWTVPNDPNGAPALPEVGAPCFLWARVHNNGTERVDNATVRYYWANPAVGFDRTTANLIGTSFVSLDPGKVADVLCLTPWVPVFVNGGHECVLAEAFHNSLDPLPGTPAFNVPTDRHVAQRNLSVIQMAGQMFHLAFEVHNPRRTEGTFSISAHMGEVAELRALQRTMGKLQIPEKLGKARGLGFLPTACPEGEERDKAKASLGKIVIGAGGRKGFSLVGSLEGPAALIHVVQKESDQVCGGLSVLVLKQKEAKR